MRFTGLELRFYPQGQPAFAFPKLPGAHSADQVDQSRGLALVFLIFSALAPEVTRKMW
jgi:hypothetical protein